MTRLKPKVTRSEKKAAIEQFLQENSPATPKEIFTATGYSRAVVIKLLPMMALEGIIHKSREHTVGTNAVAAQWTIGLGPDETEERKIRTVSKYEIHTMRDPLVAALFGAGAVCGA